MFKFFNKNDEKKEIEQLKKAVQTGFNSAKQDINNMSVWIKHLDSKDSDLKNEILDIKEDLSNIKDELENLKNLTPLLNGRNVFKQKPTVFNKQASVQSDLNTVQTPVQTVFLDNLSVTERAIIYVLLNSDMKLSYEDIATILKKRKSTIRGQINTIRQKNEGLVEEVIGENNKKRVYIPEKIKEVLLKTKGSKSKNKRSVIENESE